MIIIPTIIFIITTAIIYIPIWLPLVMVYAVGQSKFVLFYMLFALLSFGLDLFVSLVYRVWFLRWCNR